MSVIDPRDDDLDLALRHLIVAEIERRPEKHKTGDPGREPEVLQEQGAQEAELRLEQEHHRELEHLHDLGHHLEPGPQRELDLQ